MRTAVLAVASLAGLGFWYADQPIVRSGTVWLKSQLGTNYTKSSSVSSQYITAPVEEGVIRRVVTATGTLNAIINVEVGSQLSGQIAEVLVDFNDEVKRRQPLARLDQRSFQARVQEAKAALEFGDANIVMTERKLERIRIDARESEAESNVMKARVDNARIHLHAAQTELQRKQTLQSRGNATAVQLEDAITKEASAGAALREADAVAVVQKHKTAGTGADVRRVKSSCRVPFLVSHRKRLCCSWPKLNSSGRPFDRRSME